MKKTLAIVLALSMVLAIGVAAFAGDDVLYLYSTMNETCLNAVIDGWAELHPECDLEITSGTIGETTSRIAAEADNPQGDVVWGGLADSDGMQYADLFEEWVSEESANAIDGYSTPNGIYSMDHLSTVVFSINTELEQEMGLNITCYEDLLNPELKGKIIISDPNSSSAAWNNLCNIMSVFGTDSDEAWAYIEKLMPNLVISSSSSDCFKLVEAGEYAVGLTYEDGAVTLLPAAEDHFTFRYPADGASASAFGMAVIKNCQHPELAKEFVNWVCSAEGASYIAQYLKILRMTNKDTDYGTESYLPATEDIKWVVRDVDYLTQNKKAILEHWNDLYTEIAG